MKRLGLWATVVFLGSSLAWSADVVSKLNSSNGSTTMDIDDSAGATVATINSDGDANFNSVTLSGNAGNLLKNTSTLQTGATFYVSSGTVNGQASPSSVKFLGAASISTAMPQRHTKMGHWGVNNLAASQTNAQLTFDVAGSAQVAAGSRIRMPFAGRARGICVSGSAARTVGTATFQIFKNGSSIGTTSNAVIDGTNTQFVCSSGGAGMFVSGDILDIRVTTDATFAPAASTEYTAELIVDFTN